MPQDKRFVPDDRFVPDERFTLDITPTPTPSNLPEPEPSFLSSVWNTLSSPLTDLPSRIGRGISGMMEDIPITQETGQGGWGDYFANINAKAKGFFQGATEGVGDLISGLTSPVNLGMAALTGGSSLAARAGLPAIARAASMGGKVLAVPGAVHGAGTVLDPESTLAERGIGLTELAGNLAGMAHTPSMSRATPGVKIPEILEPPIGMEKWWRDSGLNAYFEKDITPPQTDIAPMPTGFFDKMAPETPPKPTLATSPIGQTIIIRKENATPEIIKRAQGAGFVFQDLNDQGHFRFKKLNESVEQPILESEVGEVRPTPTGVKEHLGPLADVKKGSVIAEVFNLPRGLQASIDFSAPLRQGIALIHKPEFWKAIKPMFKSWASEENFRASQDAIAQRPLFRERPNPRNPDKPKPSFADDAGLKLTDLTDLSRREEAIMSTWAEKVPGVRRSNRAYTAFLNNLRADTFESLVKDGAVFGADAKVNLPLARALADFVNVASGRGSLGKLESSAVALNTMLFSPRLIAARLSMLDPRRYIFGNSQVRKESLKSLLAVAAVGNTIGQLTKMAGGSVESDPNSSDFGKAKIGNTRIDPYGGFQQYVVAANRLLRPTFAKVPSLEGGTDTGIVPLDVATGFAGAGGQKVTSSTDPNNVYDLWNPQGPFDPTHAKVAGRFARGKLHPVIGFAWSLMTGKKEMSGEEMDFSTLNPMENAVAQRFIPILMQDFYELAQSEELPPELKALIGTLSTFGMGSQTYD